ncbi:MAG: SDR family oxidoreductase [Pseudomonadota bacterium]
MEQVLITGANRGIGLELTKRFLLGGKRVLATCRAPEEAVDLHRLGENERLSILELDVTNAESVRGLRGRLAGETLDVLINNAGVMGGDKQSIDDMDYAAWLHALEVNTLAPFRLLAALRDNLRQSTHGRAITLSSQMGSLSRRSVGSHAYRSSKAAVNKVMQVLALELEVDGIVVCPVHPGWVRTDMGGSNADISVEQSALGLVQLIERMTMAHTGRFWTWEGKEHPW